MESNNKVVLFVNGELRSPAHVLAQVESSDYLIAVNGGLQHIKNLGLTPDLIIGDLDSALKADIQEYRSQGIDIKQYPEDKDETDLEIALDAALTLNPTTIWVVAALGKRIDQTLANIFLLTRSDLEGFDVHLVDGQSDVFLVRGTSRINGNPGQRVSLLPINGPAKVIHTNGLKYPLDNETLYPDKTRGISNEMTASSAAIAIQKGLLLCIHEYSNKTERSS